jgi:hypothetical protein
VKRVAPIFLLLFFLALGTGTLEFLHNLEHQREDAREAAEAKAAGLPESPGVPHDDSNCEIHAQLHVPLMAAAWVPLLVLLGLFVAFLTLLAPAMVEQGVPSCLGCRGPPRIDSYR